MKKPYFNKHQRNIMQSDTLEGEIMYCRYFWVKVVQQIRKLFKSK